MDKSETTKEENMDMEHMEPIEEPGEKPKKRKKKKSGVSRVIKTVLIVLVCLVAVACVSSMAGVDDEEEEGSASISTSSSTETIDFEDITVVDNDYLTITLTDLEIRSASIQVNATIVNKDESITYMVATDDDCNIDGVQVDPLFADEVAAGKTAYSTITISNIDELSEEGVQMSDIYLTFFAYDTDDWTAEYVVDGEGVHIYPYGEDAATTFVRESAESDLVIVDNDYVTVTVLDFDPDYFWGYGVDLYIVNKTDIEIMVSADDTSINGVMCDTYWAASVGAGLSSYDTLYWFESDLDDIGITDYEEEISEIELTLDVYETDSYSSYVDSLVVTLEP